MIKLINPIKDLKDAVERGDLVEFRGRIHTILPILIEAKTAADANDIFRLKDAAIRLGIIGINTTPEEVINIISLVTKIINGAIELFVNDPDIKTETAIVNGLMDGEIPYGFISKVDAEVDLHVDYKGFVVLDNEQDFEQAVRIKLEPIPAQWAKVVVETKAIGLRQDEVRLNLGATNLIGNLVYGPNTTISPATPSGVEIVREDEFMFASLKQVTLESSAHRAVTFGLDGANVGISSKASVSGILQAQNLPFALQPMVEKWGISV